MPESSLKAFETGLYKIADSLDRKMCYNAMFGSVKTGDLPAARLMKIILSNIEHETAVDIL